MNAPVSAREMAFAALCASRAQMIADGDLLVCEAVDELQALAEHTGLIAAIGQDEAQRIMAMAFAMAETMAQAVAASLDELDAACEAEIMLRTADLVRQWELADPRDRWRHTGELHPATQPAPIEQKAPRAPPPATVAAFWQVVAIDDIDRLKAWLADHPKDAPLLLELLEAKLC